MSHLSMVERSDFLTICPTSVAERWQARKQIRILPVPLRMPLPPISLVWRAAQQHNPVVLALRDALTESLEAVQTTPPGPAQPSRQRGAAAGPQGRPLR